MFSAELCNFPIKNCIFLKLTTDFSCLCSEKTKSNKHNNILLWRQPQGYYLVMNAAFLHALSYQQYLQYLISVADQIHFSECHFLFAKMSALWMPSTGVTCILWICTLLKEQLQLVRYLQREQHDFQSPDPPGASISSSSLAINHMSKWWH